ncbi:MAG: dynamin family protein [Candidatus Omnitrophica bacterium]|nr:dynamin family protein [Candidatus Omnitrophota bacterium]
MAVVHSDTQKNNELGHIIETLLDILVDMGTGYKYHSDCIEELLKRTKHQNFYLAIVGQVKRGKSTLLNALVGEEILPSSIIPVTAIPTFVKYGSNLGVDVFFYDSGKKHIDAENVEEARNFICNYVMEEKNPENIMKVSFVEVSVPASILKERVVLIDTPGIGSTYLHNTETTLNFIPKCDAALFVTSVDPLITEVELEFLKRLSKHMKNVWIVLNKIDYLSNKDLIVCKKFIQNVLEKNGFEGKIFPVSAKMAISGKKQNNQEILAASNIDGLEDFITKDIFSKKKYILEESLYIKLKNAISEALTTMEIEIKSLKMPGQELEEKLKLINQQLSGFEKEKNIILDSLEGERKRLHESLEDYCNEVSQKARIFLHGIAEENYGKAKDPYEFYEISKMSISKAIIEFFESENGNAVRFFDAKINEITEFYNKRINQMHNFIKHTISSVFEVDYNETGKTFVFEISNRPYWVTHIWMTGFKPFGEEFLDNFLSVSRKMNRIMTRLKSQIDELVMHNVENLRWPIFQSIDRFFIKFKNFFEKYFSQMLKSITELVNKLQQEKLDSQMRDQEIIRIEERKKIFQKAIMTIEKNLINNKNQG